MRLFSHTTRLSELLHLLLGFDKRSIIEERNKIIKI